MIIDKKKLFEDARGRWPESLRVTPKEGVPCFRAEPSLTEVYRSIEASCSPASEWATSDEWCQLANWSFTQALWTLAEQVNSERLILRDEVTFDMFDAIMRSNLSHHEWTAYRKAYEASPSRIH
jgi:hypothetical protein